MINCADCKKNNLMHLESKFEIKYDFPMFSFKYLTTNKKYNLEAISGVELDEFLRILYNKIYY